MMKSLNSHVPVLAPAEFRRRIRPYLPGTVLQLCRLWPHASRRQYKLGQYFIVGPYCSGCGHKTIWLFRPEGTLDTTGDGAWLRRHFQIVHASKSRRLYTFPKPWPPRFDLDEVPSSKRMQLTALRFKERRMPKRAGRRS
jgi:hypothetical protein